MIVKERAPKPRGGLLRLIGRALELAHPARQAGRIVIQPVIVLPELRQRPSKARVLGQEAEE
jgi:hypothetical protein